MLTLKQIKNSSVANIAGVNVNDPQFANYVSEAISKISMMGDWTSLVQTMVSKVYIDTLNGVMIWPSFVEVVLAVKANGRLAPPKNFWYEFVPMGGDWSRRVTEMRAGCCGNDGYGGRCGYDNYHVVRFAGTTPVLQQPSPAYPFAIQASADNVADNGKVVTIYGTDTNGNEVYTTQNGTLQRGCTIVLGSATPYSQDNARNVLNFTAISAVTKDPTGADVKLWVFNPTTPYGQMVANYSASEISPSYLFSQISKVIQPNWKFIEALVKLKVLPVVNDNDLIPFDNLDAIKSMVQSIRKSEAGDSKGAQEFEADAIRRLNLELNTKYPLDQIESSNLTFSMSSLRTRRAPF